MVQPSFLILHKTEWERLEKQGGPPPEQPDNVRNEYFNALTEKSQEWMKTWPDTVTGRVALIEKEKKKQYKENIAFVKAYTNKNKEDTTRVIKEAKQLIFEDSCYGRKLISALLESRALEVRDTQRKFQKEIEQKEAEIEKEQEKYGNDGINSLTNKNGEREKNAKLTALECNRANKELESFKKEKELEIKLKEKQCAIEDKNLAEQVLEIEEKQKNDIKRCVAQGLDDYEAERNEIEKLKTKEKELDDALTEIHKKRQYIIQCKTQAVMKKVCQGRPDTKWSEELYKQVNQIKNEEKKRYEDFINTGIQKFEKRTSEKDTKDKQREKEKSSSRYLISQQNMTAGEQERLAKMCANKCKCDRQSLMLKTNAKPLKKTKVDTNNTPKNIEKKPKDIEIRTEKSIKTEIREKYITEKKALCDKEHDKGKDLKLPFLAPRNKLVEELKKRQKEPSPWNDSKGVHAQFAQQADSILKEVKHKGFARKVVDEYRHFNCLDDTSLPVPNY